MITKVYDSITKASTDGRGNKVKKLKEYNQSKLFIKFQDNYILDLIKQCILKENFLQFLGI